MAGAVQEESAPATAHTRQMLSERQSATVVALLSAGLEELRVGGYERLSIRGVASRAGVTHTTAYSYFTSKAHLVAEIYWRRLQEMASPRPGERGAGSVAAGIMEAIEEPALMLEREPALAQAALAAMLTDDPEVVRIRHAVGEALADRLGRALGPAADPALIETILMAFSGAMLHAGMGYFDFGGVVERMNVLGRMLDGAG